MVISLPLLRRDELDRRARVQAEVEAVIDLVGHPVAGLRLDGLRRLVTLADSHPRLRPAVVSVLGAYLRRSPATLPDGRLVDAVEAAIRAFVLAAFRTHLSDPAHPTTWCGLDVDLRGAVLLGDLSGITVSGGAVRLDRAVVPAGGTLDLRGLRVGGGLLSLDRVVVHGRVDATGLAVSGGEASLDRLRVAGGTVLLDDARVADGSVWLRDGLVEDGGTLSLRGLRLTGGRLSLHDLQVREGDVRLDDAHLDGGALHLSGATVHAGEVRLDDLRLDAGVLSLALTAVEGGLLSLAGARIGEGGTVRAHGLGVAGDARVSWGPLTAVEVPAAPARDAARDLDLRGPATDPWAGAADAADAWLGTPAAG